MIEAPPAPSSRPPKAPGLPLAPLLYLALGNWVMGSTGFVIGGILEPLALDLGVSVAAAGQLMTVYALTIALVAPLLIALTTAVGRKPLLLVALVVTGLGNGLGVWADDYLTLAAARVIMALGAGVFVPVSAAIAVALAPPPQRGRALALVFLGISTSFLLGAPSGAALAYAVGSHAPFAALAAASLGVAVLLAWRLPGHVDAPPAPLGAFIEVFKRRRLVLALGVMLLYMGGIFVGYGYIGPLLRDYSGADPQQLSWLLLTFGAFAVVGNLSGGVLLDRLGAEGAMGLGFGGLIAAMVALSFSEDALAVAAVSLVVWATAGFSLMAPQQARLVQLDGARATALLSLNASMLYLGSALGSALGGAALGPLGYTWLGPLGALLVGLAWLCLRLSRPKLSVPGAPTAAPSASP